MQFLDKALILATSCGNKVLQTVVFFDIANIKWNIGDYHGGQINACEAQKLAQFSADLYNEAAALLIEAMCFMDLGNYKTTISICSRARKLLELCGMSGGNLDHLIIL
jgi:hypothetical protein